MLAVELCFRTKSTYFKTLYYFENSFDTMCYIKHSYIYI